MDIHTVWFIDHNTMEIFTEQFTVFKYNGIT